MRLWPWHRSAQRERMPTQKTCVLLTTCRVTLGDLVLRYCIVCCLDWHAQEIAAGRIVSKATSKTHPGLNRVVSRTFVYIDVCFWTDRFFLLYGNLIRNDHIRVSSTKSPVPWMRTGMCFFESMARNPHSGGPTVSPL